MMIVGFAGRKGSGKSTAAYRLEDAGFEMVSFAQTLKLMARILMKDCGLSEDQVQFACRNKEAVLPVLGVSYRHLCQTLGTEWGRQHIHPDLWVIAARHRLLNGFGDVVFDDVRFENEAKMIRDAGGLIIHVRRGAAAGDDGHESESGIKVRDGDVVVLNDGDMDVFIDRVFDALSNRVTVS